VVGGQRHASAALPPCKTRYPLYRRLGGPQDGSGRVRKILSAPEFDPRTVQPVQSRCAVWAILTHPVSGGIMSDLPCRNRIWGYELYPLVFGIDAYSGFLERSNDLSSYIKKTGGFLFKNKRPSVSEEELYCRKLYIYIYIYIYIYTACCTPNIVWAAAAFLLHIR